ncbi:MAG: hypothetical protein NTW29_18620 [Bacteroidetes bacterium]|nr:hypothetical protein [Bacteroidota bacterium]
MRMIFLLFGFFSFNVLKSQVSLQNGSAGYEIPLFSYSDAKSGLGTGVSLSYSSGNGLVVSSKASNTGQNWSLLAGGAIFRKQNGEPDDQNSTAAFPVIPNGNGRGFNQEIAVYDQDYQSVNWAGDPYSRNYIDNYYPNGYMYSEFPLDMVEQTPTNWPLYHLAPRELALSLRFKTNMDTKWKMSRRALADRQQDVFLFQCNGMSGQFVIGRDGNIMPLGDSKLIITKTTADLTAQNIRTRINGFTITDENGIIYNFSAYELSEVMKYVDISSEGSGSFRKYVSSSEPTGKYTIQKWVLTEILNPLTQERIIFEYENYSLDLITDKTPSYQSTVGQASEAVQVYEQRARGQLKRLKNIQLPDGHKVVLIYNSNFNRWDVPDDYALAQVKVLYNNEEINAYTLGYGYMVKKEIKNYTDIIPEADKRFARLCLTTVQRTGTGQNEPPYKISYYTGSETTDPKDIVPPFDCMAQDHWGYYNKSTVVNNDDANPSKEVLKDLMLNNALYRQPSSGAARFGLLKTVENPLGGKLTFVYEQNDSKDADNPTLTKIAGGVRVSKTIVSDGVDAANDIVTEYKYKLADGSTSGWGYETPVYTSNREIKIWNASNNQGYTKEGILKYDLASAIAKFGVNTIASVGFKIAVKASFKAAKSAAMLGKLTCEEIAKINPLKDPASLYASYVIGKMIDGLFLLFNQTDYVNSTSYSFLPYQAQNPIGINYSRVEVINTSVPGGTGKVVNEFSAPANVRSEIPAYGMPYSPKQRYASWKYGLPARTAIYSQSGVLQSEQINTYNIVVSPVTGNNHKSCKVEATRPESVWCWVGSQSNAIPLTDFNWEYYYPVTGRVELVNSIEKNYSPSGIISQAEVNSTTNSDYLNRTSTTTRSNGDVIKVINYYPNDYNNISTAIQEMKNRNMLAVPISTETWLIKPGGGEFLVDATINEFDKLVNGQVKIKRIYKLETKLPLLKSIIGEQNPGILVRNNTYFKEQLSFNYDNNGLLLETVTPEQKVSTKIYDYNDRVVTADIMNASKFEVAYTSFETNQKGGWDYDQANCIAAESVTGKKVFHFPASAISLTRAVVSAKANRLSLWIKGNIPYVSHNGLTLSVLKSVNNPVTGWTYKEYMFTGSGTISITNAGTGEADIDELRLCPIDARMSTVAYDPKVGKITECDVNNRLVYYEYDGLGRLKHLRDDRRNILRKICYNYAGEPENCVDVSDNAPQWRPTGITQCQRCPFNGLYFTGVKERYEQDMNPASPTFNTYRWATDPTGTCDNPAVWVTTNTYCQQANTAPYGNTGYVITEKTDINPCSPTYNQVQQSYEYNTTSCPLPAVCNPACTSPQYKCINGVCVAGTWSVLRVRKLTRSGPWECTYVWCYPDGTYSDYYQIITSSTACNVTCF